MIAWVLPVPKREGGGRKSQKVTLSPQPITNQAQQQPKGKNKEEQANKGEKTSRNIEDVFLPKDVDPKEMMRLIVRLEYFKSNAQPL
nr:protein FAM193B-like [Salvelinus alpinus]